MKNFHMAAYHSLPGTNEAWNSLPHSFPSQIHLQAINCLGAIWNWLLSTEQPASHIVYHLIHPSCPVQLGTRARTKLTGFGERHGGAPAGTALSRDGSDSRCHGSFVEPSPHPACPAQAPNLSSPLARTKPFHPVRCDS